MKELSLNILDITMNSVKAKADEIYITINETDETFSFSVKDNGCGMSEEFVKNVIDPFCTTRTTRKVGLGIPLLKLAAEQTGGYIEISSREEAKYPDSHGTETKALFYKNHMDFTPLGDIVSTIITLIQGSPDLNFYFTHEINGKVISLSTKELKEVLGDVPLNAPEILAWISDYLHEQYQM